MKRLPNGLLERLHCLHSCQRWMRAPATPILPALGGVSVLDFSHSARCVAGSHYFQSVLSLICICRYYARAHRQCTQGMWAEFKTEQWFGVFSAKNTEKWPVTDLRELVKNEPVDKMSAILTSIPHSQCNISILTQDFHYKEVRSAKTHMIYVCLRRAPPLNSYQYMHIQIRDWQNLTSRDSFLWVDHLQSIVNMYFEIGEILSHMWQLVGDKILGEWAQRKCGDSGRRRLRVLPWFLENLNNMQT